MTLLEATKLFERSINFEIRRDRDKGDSEGVRLKTLTLIQVREAIAEAEKSVHTNHLKRA